MHTILTYVVSRSLNDDLAHRDAHQLRDIGLVRAADGTLRLFEDPSVEAVPSPRRAKSTGSWGRFLLGFVRPSRRLKTVR